MGANVLVRTNVLAGMSGGTNVPVRTYVLVSANFPAGTYVLGGTNVPERAYVLIGNNVRGTNMSQ